MSSNVATDPSTTVTAPYPAPPDPFPRRLLIVFVAVLVAIPVVFLEANRWLDGQIRLTEGSNTYVPGQELVAFSDEARVFVPYRHGEEYAYSVSLRNEGRPLRVLGFPESLGRLERLEVRVDPDPYRGEHPIGDIVGSVPFRPFTLGRDQEIFVFFRSRFAGCEHISSGIYTSLSQVPVRVRALWSTREVSVPLANPVVVGTGIGDDLHPQVVLPPECAT